MFYKPKFGDGDKVSFHQVTPKWKKDEVWVSRDLRSQEIATLLAPALKLVYSKDLSDCNEENLCTFFQDLLWGNQKTLKKYLETEIDVTSNALRLAEIEAFEEGLSIVENFFGGRESLEYKRAFMKLVYEGLKLAIDRISQENQKYLHGELKLIDPLRLRNLQKAQEAKRKVHHWLFLEKEADRGKVNEFFEYC